MKGSFSIILLVLVLLLGGFIFFFEHDSATTGEATAAARRAFHFNPADVTEVSIQTEALNLVCRKQGAQWEMIEPVDDRADEAMIQRFLHYLQLLRKSTAITAKERRSLDLTMGDYGLEDPRAVVHLRTDVDEKIYRIGSNATLGDRVYITEKDGDAVIPVDAQLWKLIPASASEWRSHDLFQEDVEHINRIAMRRDDGFIQMAKQDGDQWMLQQPVKARASIASVQQLLEMLNVIEVVSFVADSVGDAAAYGLEKMPRELSVGYDSDEASRNLLIGGEIEDLPGCVYAKWADRDYVYAVSNVFVEILKVPMDDFRDRQLVPMTALAINNVLMNQGEQVLEFLRDMAGDWNMVQPYQDHADNTLLDALVDIWCEVAVNAFVVDNVTNWNKYGFSPPLSRIFFSTTTNRIEDMDVAAESKDVFEVQVSSLRSQDGLALLRCDGGSSVYGISEELLRTLVMNPLFFRDRVVLRLPRKEILKVSLNNGVEYVAQRESPDQAFVAGGNSVGVLDATALDSLLRAVSHLQVEKYVVEDPEDLSSFGLTNPAFSLTFSLTGTAGIGKTLLIGSPSPNGNRYAIVRGQDVVFELSSTLVEILTQRFTGAGATQGELIEADAKE